MKVEPQRQVYAVILAGGSGTRFWPASRRNRPKQLLPLASERSLIAESVDRAAPLCGGRERVLIATGAHLASGTLDALPGMTRDQLLIEPAPRNTAPCIGWAAAWVARRDPEAVVMVLPSDPHIRDGEAFARAACAAIDKAAQGVICTIGIRPTRAETGYGYIEARGAPDAHGALDVARFVEKPDQARAEAFVAAGNFFWNAGMFFFRARDMLAAIDTHLPELGRGLAALDDAAAAGRETAALAEIFPALPNISIDHGVIEKVPHLAMVPGDFGWSDLGSWLAVGELAERDAAGNSAPPSSIFVDASGNHVVDMRSGSDGTAKRVIALVGVQDLVVVETDDALLVVSRDAAQRVREVVDQLRDRGDDDLT